MIISYCCSNVLNYIRYILLEITETRVTHPYKNFCFLSVQLVDFVFKSDSQVMTTRTVIKREIQDWKALKQSFGLLYCLYIVSIFYVDFNMHDGESRVPTGLECYVKLCQMSRLFSVKCLQSQIPQMSNCIKRTVKLGMHKIIFHQAYIVQTLPDDKKISPIMIFFFVQPYERMNVADALVTRSFEDGDVIIKQVCNSHGQRTYIEMKVFLRNHKELAPIQQFQNLRLTTRSTKTLPLHNMI